MASSMNQENQDRKEALAENIINTVTTIVDRQLEAKISELKDQIKFELREEFEGQAKSAAIQVQQEITRQNIISSGLG